jgi:hypothetical protein
MNNALCGWCIADLVRPEFLADRAADCPRCAEYRAYKESVQTASDCKKNPYHICGGQKNSCSCLCHKVDSLMPRESSELPPKPKITLKKRKPNAPKKSRVQS